MEKKIKTSVLVSIIIVSVIIVSIPFWNFTKLSHNGLLTNIYRELPVTATAGTFEPLVIVDDAMAASVVGSTEVSIKNRNGYDKEARLYILVEKKSTVPFAFLRVSINDEIYSLNEISPEEDTKNYYFYLNTYQIDAYKEEKLETRLWLSQDTNGVEPTATIVTNFVIR